MTIKKLSLNAILASLLFVVYLTFSQILYLEFLTFSIILISLNVPRKDAILIVVTFVILVWLVYGINLWSLMYLIIYPGFAFLISVSKKIIKKSEYYVAITGFTFALLAGNLIDLPFILFSKELTLIYLVLGFKTTLVQAVICFTTILIIYQKFESLFISLLKKGKIYE